MTDKVNPPADGYLRTHKIESDKHLTSIEQEQKTCSTCHGTGWVHSEGDSFVTCGRCDLGRSFVASGLTKSKDLVNTRISIENALNGDVINIFNPKPDVNSPSYLTAQAEIAKKICSEASISEQLSYGIPLEVILNSTKDLSDDIIKDIPSGSVDRTGLSDIPPPGPVVTYDQETPQAQVESAEAEFVDDDAMVARRNFAKLRTLGNPDLTAAVDSLEAILDSVKDLPALESPNEPRFTQDDGLPGEEHGFMRCRTFALVDSWADLFDDISKWAGHMESSRPSFRVTGLSEDVANAEFGVFYFVDPEDEAAEGTLDIEDIGLTESETRWLRNMLSNIVDDADEPDDQEIANAIAGKFAALYHEQDKAEMNKVNPPVDKE